jgi:putative N6-adenine-specific DNA methylase
MQKQRIFISAPKGIPPILKQEIVNLGFPVSSEGISGVETEGTMDDAMRLNLHLRTGHRVLVLLKEFQAAAPDELFRAAYSIAWEELIAEDGYVCITSSVDTPTIRDSRFATLRCKDAIVDKIKDKRGTRPDSGPERDRTVVHLYWNGERGSIYIDTSGEPLSRRGYRKIPLAAPMQETLAAAVVLATGWDGSKPFINPMCGSGTLAIEAALIGLNRAPGLLRNNFGFMHIKGYNEARWNELRDQAKKEMKKSLSVRITATDIEANAVEAAKRNAATAGVEQMIDFSVCDYADTPLPAGGGVIVLNPAYGERMGEIEQLTVLYKGIGDFFKQKCKGFMGYVFTGNPSLSRKVSLKPKRSMQFYNSGIECRLLEYELYEGTRKFKKEKAQPE